MPAQATLSTRDRLVRTAHDMFYRSGFQAVGLDAILDEVGISKTAFYHHFNSKDDLVAEVLRWHDRWWQDSFREILRRHGGATAGGQLQAVFCALDELFARKDYNGCFFVNVAVQFPLAHDPAHQAAADHKEAMQNLLEELAGYAGADDPRALAEELSIVMEGAYVTRQVTGRAGTPAIARRVGRLILDHHLPPARAE